MSRILRSSSTTTAATIVAFAVACLNTGAAELQIPPHSMPAIASVDERFLSYNIEMAEVVGGTFWKPYSNLGRGQSTVSAAARSASSAPDFQIGESSSLFKARPPVDLANPRLRTLAAALGPVYLRVSSTSANSVYFDESDRHPPAKAPRGFHSVLTRAEWKGVIDCTCNRCEDRDFCRH